MRVRRLLYEVLEMFYISLVAGFQWNEQGVKEK